MKEPKHKPRRAAFAYERLTRIAPYAAKERLRRAVIACGGNLNAIAVVLGYSPWSEGAIRKWIKRFDLHDEIVEARRRRNTRNRKGELTHPAREMRESAAKLVRDAKRREKLLAKRAEIQALLNE